MISNDFQSNPTQLKETWNINSENINYNLIEEAVSEEEIIPLPERISLQETDQKRIHKELINQGIDYEQLSNNLWQYFREKDRE